MENDTLELDPSIKNKLTLNICNVCAIANLRCHLNLSHIAQHGVDVEYDSFLNVLKTKLRKPKVGLAQFWSNGKMSVFGCDNIDNARKGCRILARRIKKLGYNVKFDNFQIVNILTKLQLPFKIRIHEMVNCDHLKFIYEPELDPNLYYYPKPKNRGRKYNEYKTMAKLTTNGKVTIHSSSIEEAENIAEEVYKLSLAYVIPDSYDKSLLEDQSNTDAPINETDNGSMCITRSITNGHSPSVIRPRKRVVVKTYVEDDETISGRKTKSENEDPLELITLSNNSHDNINSISSSVDSFDVAKTQLFNSKMDNLPVIGDQYSNCHQALFDSIDLTKTNSPISNMITNIDNSISSTAPITTTTTTLSLLETQDILDDLLN